MGNSVSSTVRFSVSISQDAFITQHRPMHMTQYIENDQPTTEEQTLLSILIEEVRLALQKTEQTLARNRRGGGNVNNVETARI